MSAYSCKSKIEHGIDGDHDIFLYPFASICIPFPPVCLFFSVNSVKLDRIVMKDKRFYFDSVGRNILN